MKFEYFQGISLSYSKPLIDGMHEKRPWLTFDLRSNSSIVAKGIFFAGRIKKFIRSPLGWTIHSGCLMAPGTTHVCRFMGEGAVEKGGNPSPLQFIIIKYLLRMLEVVLSKDYLHITDCSPPSYSANLPHLIGISRTTIPLSPMRARYLEDGLNSIESTSNRGASVQTKVCWQESMFSRSQCITQSACHFPTTNEYLH